MWMDGFDLHGCRVDVGFQCARQLLASADLESYSKVIVFSQPPIWEPHGAFISDTLNAFLSRWECVIIPDGEKEKNLTRFGALLEQLAAMGADRRSLLIVVGGGVLGDLIGFVASCYMRGLDWIYLPTTLLAQQDASVGGKVAVNLDHGKNLAGHFWHPKRVIIDTCFLKTLPRRHRVSGSFEWLKHGILSGPELFEEITCADLEEEQGLSACLPLMARALRIKAQIVEEDPVEQGPRRLLNLGHTLAHALERESDYGILHGEAVGMGLLFAAMLGRALGSDYDWSILWEWVTSRLSHRKGGVPHPSQLVKWIQKDKKRVGGVIHWVIPRAPGNVEIRADVDPDLVEEVLSSWYSAFCNAS